MNRILILVGSFISVFLIFLIIGLLQLIFIIEKTEQEQGAQSIFVRQPKI